MHEKILVVDDIATNRKLLGQMLRKINNYNVVEAVDGVDAITKFETENPDLILMDINMPKMGGFESATTIKKLTGDNYIPIIFITAMSAESSLTEALASGGDDFIGKPFEIEVLKSKINVHLRIRNLNKKLIEMSSVQRRHTDLMEQKNRELHKTLQELKSQKQALDEHNIVSIADIKGNIIYANEKFSRISGFSLNELTGENHRIVNSAFHNKAFWENLWQTIVSGATWYGQIRNRNKSGGYYWVDTTIVPFLDEAGKVYPFVSVRTDITALMDAKNSLQQVNRELQQQMEMALQGANLGLWDWHIQTGEVYFDKRYLSMLGYQQGEIEETVQAWDSLLHPDDKQRVIAEREAHLAGKIPSFDVECRQISRDGSWKWIQSSGQIMQTDKNEKAVRMLGVHQDINARKWAEESQQQERKFSSTILNTASSIILVLDPQGRIVRLNHAGYQLTGYSSDELVGKIVWEILIPLDMIEKIKQVFKQLTEGHSPSNNRGEWLCKDGSRRVIDWANSTLIDANGQVSYVIATGIDVTEKQSAQDRLIASEQKFKSIFDYALDGMMLMDLDTRRVISVNHQLSKMSGIEDKLMTNLSVLELFPEWARDKVSKGINQAEKNTFAIEHDVPLLNRDGNITYTDVNASLIELKGKKCFLAIFRDISERRKAAQKLQRAYKYKSEFLANMSHELRTPLNAIIGFSRAMLKGIDGPVNDEQRESLEIIANSGEHLKGIIDNILDISKLEAGRMEIHYQDVKICPLLEDMQKTINLQATEKGLKVTLSCDDQLDIVLADEQRMRQIILNLLSNAVKYSDEGDINISASLLTGNDMVLQLPQEICQGLEQKSDYLLVSIKDSGIGIEIDKQDDVFAEFRQLDNSSTRHHGGTGLGMAITKKMIEMHHGKIWFVSEFGQGSTFYFVIPRLNTSEVKI